MEISNGVNSPVRQIKEKLSIEEVISSYIKLDQSGSNFKAKCPFHNEKTPSFFVSKDRGTYYCFGCGAKGDVFTFVEEFEGLDFKGALKILADRAGVSLSKFTKENIGEKEKLFQVIEVATNFFEKNLNENKDVLKYLKGRGVEDKTIKEFRIGFSKSDWRSLFTYLETKGFKPEEIEKAGLVKKTDKGYYDRFRGRIMFPISDSSGRIIAFSGRIFIDDEKSAKYLNSPETPIFSKSYVLYGLDKAKESIRKNNFSILVEGQIDLILSHQAGFRNTVATSGTALSNATVSKENVVSNLGLLRRLSSNIVIAFDADKAGFNASTRASKIALSLGMDVKIATMPEGVDPADLIFKNGIDEWRSAIRNSKHIIEFLLERILYNYREDTRKAGREIKEKILPYVDVIESSIEKDNFIKKISNLSQISEEALKEDLLKIEKEFKYEREEIEKIEEDESILFRRDFIERRLLGIILWQRNLKEKSIDLNKITKEFIDILKIKEEELIKKNENKEDLIFEAEIFYGNEENLKQEIKELLDNLKEEYLKVELNLKMRELRFVEEQKDFKKSAQILRDCQIINNKIQDIKNNNFNK